MQLHEPKREFYADFLRILAAFTVVFQHTVSSAWYTAPVNSSEFAALNFLNSMSRFGVGVFIMLSGAFMLSPQRPHPPEKIFMHNLPRTLLPLAFWVVFYGVIEHLTAGESVLEILKTPFLLFTKPASHLWFLYTLAGLYVLTPPLRVFTAYASRKMQLYVIALFFAFGLMVPTINHLLSTFADFTLYKNIGIQGTTSFVGFYLTGFYLAHFEIGPRQRKALYLAALASWITAFVASTYISETHNAPNEYFFGNFRPTTFLMSAGIFCLIKKTFSDGSAQKVQNLQKFTAKFSGCMLGVYLIHPLFIKIFYGLNLTLLIPHPIFTAPVAASTFFIVSLCATYALKKIKITKIFL